MFNYDLIAQYGLATAITVYLLIWVTGKLSNQLERLTEAIDKNTEVLTEIKGILSNS